MVFFFKQKTAYEMRISDWSSDVCSSDLRVRTPHGTVDNVMRVHSLRPHTMDGHVTLYRSVLHNPDIALPLWFLECIAVVTSLANKCDRSEERRVGKECVSTCRSRGSPYP